MLARFLLIVLSKSGAKLETISCGLGQKQLTT